MTESVQPGRVILAPNGVTTAFALPFRALTDPVTNKTNLVVKPVTISTGVIGAALVEGTDYTVSNVGSDTCSIVTEGASSPWGATSYLVAYTSTAVEQETTYTYNGPFPSADAEAALDWLTQIARNHEDRLNRSLKFSIAYPVTGALNADVPVPPLNGATIYWDTTAGWTWTTVPLAALQAQAALLAGIEADIVTVASISAAVTSVAADETNIGTVAQYIANVNAVAVSITSVNNVNADLTNINLVAADLTNINLVGASISNVNAVAADLTNINAVHGQLTAIENVAADLTNINLVAADLTNINAVSADLTQIVGVYNDLTQIVAVYNDLTDINGVYADLANINAVFTDLTNINTVAGIATNVTTVAGMQTNIATIIANMTTITNAANNIPKANLAASVAPTVNNDGTQGYSAGSLWVDTTHNALYFATSVATGAANWINAFSASALSSLSDVVESGLANHDVFMYNSGTSKWNNVAAATALSNMGGAPLASPTFTGTPAAPTATGGTNTTQLATTAFVTSAISTLVSGMTSKGTAACVATANIAGTYLSGVFTITATGALTIDGVSCPLGTIVALVGQTVTGGTGTVNGLYTVTTAGNTGISPVLTRATNYNTTAEVQAGTYFIVSGGTSNSGTFWLNNTSGTVTLDSTALTFVDIPIGSLAASALTGTTLASNVVTSSLTAVGTIATGAWQGTKVSATYGGTGLASNASTGVAQVLSGTWSVSTALASGTTATTQSAADNSTNLATTAYVDQVGGYNNQTGTTIAIGAAQRRQTINFTGASACVATLASNAGITGGSTWWCILANNSAVNLTLQATTSTVDGVTGASGYIMYPGEKRLIEGDGTNYVSQVLLGFAAKFLSSGSFQRPPGYLSFEVETWSSGQAGASRSTTGNAGGGSAGVYSILKIPATAFVAVGSTETVTIGATAAGVSGNTNGTLANATSFTVNGVSFSALGLANAGSLQTAPANVAISTICAGGVIGLYPLYPIAAGVAGYPATGGDVTVGNVPEYINGAALYGNSIIGGGAGGACSSTAGGTRTGCTSLLAGAGGTGGANTGGNGTGGSVPSGGGGAAVQGGTSGSGGAGQLIWRGYA